MYIALPVTSSSVSLFGFRFSCFRFYLCLSLSFFAFASLSAFGLLALHVTSNAKKSASAFWRCMNLLALGVDFRTTFWRWMLIINCFSALDVPFGVGPANPLLKSGVGGTLGACGGLQK